MKYMFLLFDEKTNVDLSPEEAPRCPPSSIAPARLKPWSPTRRSNRRRPLALSACAVGERITTDGPFVETKEQLGGFFAFDCESLEPALDPAAKIPRAATGHVEVRAVDEV